MDSIECSCCGETFYRHSSCTEKVEPDACYVLYVGLGNYQYICDRCQKKSFKEVMKNLDKGKVYVSGTYKTMEELKAESSDK